MQFRLWVTVLLLVQLGGARLQSVALSRPLAPDADAHIYLPYVAYEPPLQIVVTATGFPSDRPGFTVSGYVLNRTNAPLYDVRLRVTISVPNSINVAQAMTFTITGYTSMDFPASLPGRPNPFVYVSRGGQRSAVLDGIQIDQALDKSLGDDTSVVLNASNWVSSGSMITGTLLNDTALPVRDAGVAIILTGPAACSTQGAFVLTTTLQPGEATQYFASICEPGLAYPVAQGIVAP